MSWTMRKANTGREIIAAIFPKKPTLANVKSFLVNNGTKVGRNKIRTIKIA